MLVSCPPWPITNGPQISRPTAFFCPTQIVCTQNIGKNCCQNAMFTFRTFEREQLTKFPPIARRLRSRPAKRKGCSLWVCRAMNACVMSPMTNHEWTADFKAHRLLLSHPDRVHTKHWKELLPERNVHFQNLRAWAAYEVPTNSETIAQSASQEKRVLPLSVQGNECLCHIYTYIYISVRVSWHSIWHSFWRSIWYLFWHTFWHILYADILAFWLHLFWHSFWHSILGILSGIYSDILFCHSIQHAILAFYLAFISDILSDWHGHRRISTMSARSQWAARLRSWRTRRRRRRRRRTGCTFDKI